MMKKFYYFLCKRDVVKRARSIKTKKHYSSSNDPVIIAARNFRIFNSLDSDAVNFSDLLETWKNFPQTRKNFDYTKTKNPLLQSIIIDLHRNQYPNCEAYQKRFDLTVALINAFVENKPEEFEQLLKQGANPNDVGPYTRTIYDPEISYRKTDFVSVNQLLENEQDRINLFQKILSNK